MADYDLQYQDTHIDVLLDAANELKTNGYIYKGVATPSTNPGTPTERVAYLASEPGTYTNFGGIVIASGLYSLTYASGTWTGTQMQAGSDIEVVQTTGQSATAVMSQKAVTDELNTLSENLHDVEEALDEVAGNEILSDSYNCEEDGFHIIDNKRNVGLRYDNDGLDIGKASRHFANVVKRIGVDVGNIADVFGNGLFICDESLNIGFSVDSEGVHAPNMVEFETVDY